jgi:nitric-oxide synthase
MPERYAPDIREVSVDLRHGRILPDFRRRIPRHARSRARQPGPDSFGLPFEACPERVDRRSETGLTADPVAADNTGSGFATSPVAADGTEGGFAVGRDMLPAGWPSAGSDSSTLNSLLASARRFITQFHDENRAGPPDRRLQHVRREIEATGTYWHTPAELAFGARVAWRNSSRCIGRLYWQSLRVRDRREVTTAAGIAAESAAHLREATNRGRVRSMITVFAPDTPYRPGPRILSSQLIRYAGHKTADGSVIGDPANKDVTRLARALGWSGGRPAGRFDMLPLIVQEADALPVLHELPSDAVLEVTIRHPDFTWFADLGLRWHAVPVISDMFLDIGGVRYPAAPFNGWYMCTEVGSRDLGDADRYDQLPVIARHMGLSTAGNRNLWKDKAMTELNLAVLHSFGTSGVTISDHHTESARFLQHIEREERHGRVCPADWTWIVPPAASSATPVFHRHYQDFDQSPNFYRHPAPDWLTEYSKPANLNAQLPDSVTLGKCSQLGARHRRSDRPMRKASRNVPPRIAALLIALPAAAVLSAAGAASAAASATPGVLYQSGPDSPGVLYQSGPDSPGVLYQSGPDSPGVLYQSGPDSPGVLYQSGPDSPGVLYHDGPDSPGVLYHS